MLQQDQGMFQKSYIKCILKDNYSFITSPTGHGLAKKKYLSLFPRGAGLRKSK